MKNKLINLTKNPFVRNVIIMVTGTAAAQVISILLAPVITRLYGPEAYGLMGTFMAIFKILVPVAALTYPIAMVLPKRDADAKGLMRLSVYIAFGIAAVTAMFLLFFNQQLVQWFQLQAIAPYLYLIPLVILFAGFMQVMEQWLIRTQQFGIVAKVSFFHALITHGGKAGIGLFYPLASVLIVLTAIGEGLKALLMFLLVKGSDNHPAAGAERGSMKKLAKKHRDFPMFRAPESFLSTASQNLPILLLTSFFGPASAGFYTIGRTVLSLPVRMVGKSVGDVFYPRISQAAQNRESLSQLITKATLSLGGIGIIPFGLVIAFGPWLFNFVFGSDWETAGEYARWMALWSMFGFMNRPSVRSLAVLSAQGFHLVYTIFMLVVRVAALAVGYYVFASDTVAVALFGVTSALLNIGLIAATLYISKKYDAANGRINENDDNV